MLYKPYITQNLACLCTISNGNVPTHMPYTLISLAHTCILPWLCQVSQWACFFVGLWQEQVGNEEVIPSPGKQRGTVRCLQCRVNHSDWLPLQSYMSCLFQGRQQCRQLQGHTGSTAHQIPHQLQVKRITISLTKRSDSQRSLQALEIRFITTEQQWTDIFPIY